MVSTISNTNTNPVSSGIEYRCQEQKFPANSSSTNKSFHSSYARCLNMPPMMLDQTSWLENELLETRQVSQRPSIAKTGTTTSNEKTKPLLKAVCSIISICCLPFSMTTVYNMALFQNILVHNFVRRREFVNYSNP